MGVMVNPDGSITVGIIPEEGGEKTSPSLPTEKNETVVSEVKPKRGRKPKQE
jgi:hypothetical protein